MFDEPDIIDDWVRERVLGTGGFGIVTLWKNSSTGDAFGRLYCLFSFTYFCVNKNDLESYNYWINV